jgi:ubiquitin-like domain-containing CTD phosphatase 1
VTTEIVLGRPLLVLDLDEALWHGVEDASAESGYRFLLRPHLATFLKTVSVDFDLAVWTAASEDWMRVGLATVQRETGFELEDRAFFLWHRARCTMRRNPEGQYELVKHARKFRASWIRERYPRERILVIDDQVTNYASGYGHLVRVSGWTGEVDDTELLQLAQYLGAVASEPDLRKLEKRGWRARVALLDSPHL